MINAKIISSLEKCFPDTDISGLAPLERISVLRGERLSFQLVYREEDNSTAPGVRRAWRRPRICGELAPFASMRLVELVPSLMPAYPGRHDGDYLSTEPGLYPDLLGELSMGGQIPICNFQTRALWISIKIPDGIPAGEYEVGIDIRDGENLILSRSLTVMIIAAALPAQSMYVAQWLHCDCLADYYGVKVFSERHWEIITNFVRVAVENGINTILTPIFTPPLDTAPGHERPTVQLVEVSLAGGEYSFDFTLLDRWIDMCCRLGVTYFEIPHFFTQWGAAHAPKIVATINSGKSKRKTRIFGWDTDATGEEYTRFLHRFIPDFIAHMRSRGLDKRCVFHVSDEPNMTNIEQYGRSRAMVAPLLEGYTVMDALSNIEFWRRGYVATPCAANNHIEPFLEARVPNLWTYYCCSQGIDVSNRFFAMPGARTRCIGMQLYKYNIAGFLHWGYNFYYNQGSFDLVNPYADSTGGYFYPSGDGYSVYPAAGGYALESMRLVQFYEALQDRRAMELCESFYGKERVIAELEAVCGGIKFSKCITDSAQMLAVRERVNDLIAEAVNIT